jgi:hypothetical protein
MIIPMRARVAPRWLWTGRVSMVVTASMIVSPK